MYLDITNKFQHVIKDESQTAQGSIHNLHRGWAMMILRGGVTLFPYYDLGGAVENFQRKLY